MKPLTITLIAPALCLVAFAGRPVKLSWDPSPDAWIAGYNVYRSDHPGGPINPALVPDTWYTDEAPNPGGDYCYRVTAVSVDGVESDPSSEVCVDLFHVTAGPDRSAQTGDMVVLVADTGLSQAVTYQWSQLSGLTITPASWTSRELTFLAPETSEPADLRLQVTARYGTKTQTTTVTLTLTP